MHRTNKPKKVTSWQVIGCQVSHFRKLAHLTQEQLAELLNISVETIGSIEQGRRPLKMDLAERLDEALDTKGALAVAVSKVPEREKFPAFAQDFVEEEQEAVTLLSYQTQVVPGLLQTPAYARAVFACRFPPTADEQAEDWVTARINRQQVWHRKAPPVANFILEESMLHRPVGGPEVMREQLLALKEFAGLPSVGVQIMRTDCMPHAGLAGPMVLLETPDHQHLAYLEGHRVSLLVDDPDEVSVYQQKYGMLRSQALSPPESLRLLDGLLGESS